jgi:sigma-E factor negative regulatory protein RseA
MTQQQENLSAFVDGELRDERGELIDALSQDSELHAKWCRYHAIGDMMRGECAQPQFDISAKVAEALADEPTVLAPKKRTWADIPLVGNVVPLVKQSGQFLVAASVAAVAILGVQNYNAPVDEQPFMTAPPIAGPQGGLAPVSLEQTRTVQRNDMEALLEQRRQLNALIADHQRQLQLKQAQLPQAETVEQEKDASEDESQP